MSEPRQTAQEERPWKLRPHHLLDIVNGYGHGQEFKPHPYGHAVHVVAAALKANVDMKVRFIVGADDICRPCKHLGPDGRCDDITHSVTPPGSKQEYNDKLDRRVLEHLGFPAGTVMTARQFLQIVDKKLDGLDKICHHGRETPESRRAGLEAGLRKLGLRKA